VVHNLVKSEDLDWLACAIDGEGTISGNPKSINPRFQIAVYNTDYSFAKKAADLMGVKPCPLKYKVKGETRIIYSAYTSRKMTVLKILKQVESRLVIKRMKALAAIRSILDSYDIADIELRAYPSLP